MSFLGACLSLTLALGFGLLGILLSARALVSLCPGSLLLNLRRRLFLWTQPFLGPVSSWFSFRLAVVDWTALILAVVCFLAVKGLAPWVALAGFGFSAG